LDLPLKWYDVWSISWICDEFLRSKEEEEEEEEEEGEEAHSLRQNSSCPPSGSFTVAIPAPRPIRIPGVDVHHTLILFLPFSLFFHRLTEHPS